jgi:hypothetical protein
MTGRRPFDYRADNNSKPAFISQMIARPFDFQSLLVQS